MNLEIDGMTVRYGEEVGVRDVSFEVAAGEIVGILGPSGCGKTTIVQAIAGHVQPARGHVYLGGEDVTRAPPESRGVGVLFQESTLYPHMTVEENVAYGLRARGDPPADRADIVAEHLDRVALAGQRRASPDELSGGQQRRAELARCLATQPDVLLLDEPLSGLDRELARRMQREILRIQRDTGITTVFVTHDQGRAMAMADRLVVMNAGTIDGIGSPRALYRSPPSAHIAAFLWRTNAVRGSIVDDDPAALRIGEQVFDPEPFGYERCESDAVVCHVRPDQSSLGDDTNDTAISLPGTVAEVVDTGRRFDVVVRLETGAEVIIEHHGSAPRPGADTTIVVPQDALAIFPI